MRKLLFLLLIPIALCGATFYSWRYREHAVDCTAITDGRARDLCFEVDDEHFYKCEPTVVGEACDTADEWKQITQSPGGNDTEVQFNDGGVFGGDSTFHFNKSTERLTAATVYATALRGGSLVIDNNATIGGDSSIDGFLLILGDHGVPPDNRYIGLGASEDLQLYHDGTDSYIINDTGILYIDSETMSISGPSDSQFNIKTITEEVTIAIGDGFDPVVVTSGNLAPAGSLIVGVSFRITDAPGGGATVIDIGRTNGGNLDEFIDGASCDVLDEVGNNYTNGDTVHTGIQRNVSADTLTLTLDADVTVNEMKVRIVVFYRDLTAPTS